MVREEIVEGLRMALGRGESLLQAMMSFYNAGYLKKEVEEAAQALNQTQLQTQLIATQQPIKQPIQSSQAQAAPTQNVSQYGSQASSSQEVQQPNFQTPVPNAPQGVSNYSGKGKHPLSTGLTIFLAIVLLLLVSSLISLLLFRDVFSDLLGGLF